MYRCKFDRVRWLFQVYVFFWLYTPGTSGVAMQTSKVIMELSTPNLINLLNAFSGAATTR